MYMERFTNKVALVTAGARGIGQSSAERLCMEGARVVVADYNADGVYQTVADFRKRGFVADGLEKDWMGVHILPVECFCPVLTTGENLRCERTYCEHKGLHSWSGNGGWKVKLLGLFGQKWKTRLIKWKRRILG